ncbi:MAG: hypothetical protein DHS20C15_26780 [Planctomycetota bacterium]|nr:MAG: hypothetical protein DHS20C15_26780 [Planctomycetota bacterium]
MSPTSRARPPSRRKRLLVVLCAPVLGLALVELVLQVRASQGVLPTLLSMTGARARYDDCDTLQELLHAENYTWEPGDVVGDYLLNSQSLRTPEYSVEKASGTRRVVILGDSHSFRSGGVPTNLLWDRRVAADLREDSEVPLEFINLAVPAVGPWFEWRMWQLEGSKLQPDLVILAFSVSNDFMEIQGNLSDRTEFDSLAREWLVVRFVRNLWLLATAGSLEAVDARPPVEHNDLTEMWNPTGKRGEMLPGAENRYDRDKPGFPVKTHTRIVYSRMAISDPTRSQVFEDSVTGVRHFLTQLNREVRALDAELVLLLIPAEHQVDDALLERVALEKGRRPGEFDTRRAQRELHAICDELGVSYVDPLDAVRSAVSESTIYRPRETHMTDIGHAILAEHLAAKLRDIGWSATR